MVDDCVYHSFSDLYTHFALLWIVSNIRFGWLFVSTCTQQRALPHLKDVSTNSMIIWSL